ncbi:MAG: hypothetical protein WBV77_00410 [Solirubrobacteraceae bacterium]
MSFLVALIGTRDTTTDDIDAVLDYHLRQRPAFWSGAKHDRWAQGTRVVAKMAGVGLVVLTGTLDCLGPVYDPLERHGQTWDWRYDIRWDARPPQGVPVSELGLPFARSIRSAQGITREEFDRAYSALHGRGPRP